MRSEHRLPWLAEGIAGTAFEGKAGDFG